ncbi:MULTISPECIES: TRAP transporter small permease [unclassified Brenneria]|uniref:TRAP transporter small permease n=1 Tax=unclassified Brenneria TaxID=2634434 RepID=UPI0029C5589E|nr:MULTISPECIES: TRAP transporter small permease [unclassified Brenneria]MDX5630061.1 TRAP transporter small permease [Brenneria sp. L3-3Z]MDX5697207.1 TRAP transporter small permease [Brenneria sp. L4-2C]
MKKLIRIEVAIARIMFVAMVILILVAAIGRCVGYPLIWSIEISMVLFAWISMFSIHYAQANHRNMGIDFLSKRLPEKLQNVFDYINKILIIAFLGFGAGAGYLFTWDTRAHVLPVSEISQVFVNAAVPTGCLLLMLTCIEQLIEKVTSTRALPARDHLS